MRAIDLFAGRPDPYPLYEELREQHDGVHFVEEVNMWLLCRYPDVQRLTTERARWSSAYFDDMPVGIYTAGDPAHDRYAHVMRRNLMMNDAPDHARLRKLLNHAFTGRATKTWDEMISRIVDEVLDAVPVDTPFDLFNEIGEIVPLDVIASLLGVPVRDRRLFRRLSVAFATNLSPGVVGEERDRTVRESVELFDYVQALADEAERESLGGLMGALVRAEEDGSTLTRDEIVAQVCMLLAVGNETTADLITTGIALLLEDPEQLELMRTHRELVDPALLEILRYRAPLQFSPRLTTENVTDLGPEPIPKGSKVLFGHGPGNRDPRQFDRPVEFDIRRGDRRHLAFAAGARTSASVTSSPSPKVESS